MRARRERNSAEVIDVAVLRQLDAIIALKNIACEVEVTLVSCRAVKLDERQFNLRMPGENRFFIGPRAKIGQKVAIDETDTGIEQRAIARRAIKRNRALN